jgi:hypothetical protein
LQPKIQILFQKSQKVDWYLSYNCNIVWYVRGLLQTQLTPPAVITGNWNGITTNNVNVDGIVTYSGFSIHDGTLLHSK